MTSSSVLPLQRLLAAGWFPGVVTSGLHTSSVSSSQISLAPHSRTTALRQSVWAPNNFSFHELANPSTFSPAATCSACKRNLCTCFFPWTSWWQTTNSKYLALVGKPVGTLFFLFILPTPNIDYANRSPCFISLSTYRAVVFFFIFLRNMVQSVTRTGFAGIVSASLPSTPQAWMALPWDSSGLLRT